MYVARGMGCTLPPQAVVGPLGLKAHWSPFPLRLKPGLGTYKTPQISPPAEALWSEQSPRPRAKMGHFGGMGP